jgi:hypothetical protein
MTKTMFPLSQVYRLLEPGPVVLVTTVRAGRANIMTMSWHTMIEFALADQLELRLAQARGRVAKLTPSLLARAFAGKLLPQNPAEEPAEKLLERIQTSRKGKA